MKRIIFLKRESGEWTAWNCAETGMDESTPAATALAVIARANPDAMVVVTGNPPHAVPAVG